jgi:hypothetical protein
MKFHGLRMRNRLQNDAALVGLVQSGTKYTHAAPSEEGID